MDRSPRSREDDTSSKSRRSLHNFPVLISKKMTRSHVSGGFWMGLPAAFCSNYLSSITTEMKIVLEDADGKSWDTKYLPSSRGLSGGWRRFALDHKLEVGNTLLFRFLSQQKCQVTVFKEKRSISEQSTAVEEETAYERKVIPTEESNGESSRKRTREPASGSINHQKARKIHKEMKQAEHTRTFLEDPIRCDKERMPVIQEYDSECDHPSSTTIPLYEESYEELSPRDQMCFGGRTSSNGSLQNIDETTSEETNSRNINDSYAEREYNEDGKKHMPNPGSDDKGLRNQEPCAVADATVQTEKTSLEGNNVTQTDHNKTSDVSSKNIQEKSQAVSSEDFKRNIEQLRFWFQKQLLDVTTDLKSTLIQSCDIQRKDTRNLMQFQSEQQREFLNHLIQQQHESFERMILHKFGTEIEHLQRRFDQKLHIMLTELKYFMHTYLRDEAELTLDSLE